MKKIDIQALRPRGRRFRKIICIMKLHVVFLLLSFQVAAKGLSQKVTLNVKNERLGKVLSSIEQQTGYRFGYSDQVVPTKKEITFEASGEDVRRVLDRLLNNLQLDYREEAGKLIIIFQKPVKAADSGGTTRSGDGAVMPATEGPGGSGRGLPTDTAITIKGKVITIEGAPIAGASVVVKGSSLGTTTNEQGDFVLGNVRKGRVLEVSFVGFDPVEISMDNRAFYAIQLHYQTDAGKMDEVVVEGYGKETRKNLMGTITQLTAKDIQNEPVDNVLSALEGKVTGLDISTTSGTPGAGVQVRLRGINTMNDASTISGYGTGFVALILVDGIPVTDLSYLSPADIESVEVLKDASATAIYGSRAAGGVILITTKRGKRGTGPGKLSFQAYTSVEQPTKRVKMLNSAQYRTIREEGYANDGITPTEPAAPDLYMDSTVNTDWGKTLYQNALTQDYQLNFSGGSPNINYYISGGYRDQGAIVKGDWYLHRINTHMGLDAKVSERLTVGGSVGFSNTANNLYNEAIASTVLYAIPLIPAETAGKPNLTAYPTPFNNPNRQLTAFNSAFSNQFLGNFYFNYQIWKQLYFRTDISYQLVSGQSTSFSPTTSAPYSTSYLGYYPSGAYGYTNNNGFTLEPQLNYAITRGKSNLKLLAGGTLINNNSRSTSLSMTGYSNNQLTTLASATTYSYDSYSEMPYKFASAFGRASYNYDEKYLLEGVFRRDGSSRFGADYEYGNFWSVGAGWIFSKASFAQHLFGQDFFGKLKATYGITGNDNIGNFGYLSYSGTGLYGGNTATYLSNLANPYLKWEQTAKLDFELDLGLFKNRINVTANYFRHRTTGTLFSEALSAVTGFTSITANLDGVVANNGFELALGGDIIRSGHFKWTSQFNISFLTNKLLNLPGLSGPDASRYAYSFKIGQPLALNWGFKYQGVDPATGLAKFQGVTGTQIPELNTPDDQILGKTIPDYYGGWNNSFVYKHLELDVLTQFTEGIQKQYTSYTSGIGDEYNLPVSALARWQKAGDITNIPRAAAPGTAAAINNDNITSSSFVYSNASYIRIKNITLSYTFPGSPRWKVSNLRVFVTGYNLFTQTHYQGNDPESGPSAIPVTKTYTAGVNVTL
jgi:TonB-linked SusC/RagA family outer membrane protein